MSTLLLAMLAGATVAALPPARTRGVGAAVPFVEYEAERLETNGTVLPPERRFGTLAAEASGRSAVRLEGEGAFVAVTLERPAEAITVRYAVPDTPDGRGGDWTLGVEADGVRIASLPTTSRYGWFYGRYPFSNDPGQGGGHHFFDHARLRFGRTLPRGTRLVLRIGAGDRAPWYAIDVLDLERVPPPRRPPAGALSVVRMGADPTGVRPSTHAFRAGIAAARAGRRTLWIPPGRYRVDGHLEVDRVTIAGAGMWYSELRGDGIGLYGRAAEAGGSRDVRLRDFALVGEVTERVDDRQLSGIGGAMHRTRIERLWLQHHKVGLWFDGPMRDVSVRHARILDMTADGLNFRRGVRRAVAEHLFVRGTGDDGLAAWSHRDANAGVRFRRNTVIAPVLANGIAVYGGRDIRIDRNLVADTVTQGGGIHVGNRFDAVPVSGRVRIAGNVAVRAGSWDPNWRHGVGAIWFYALDAPILADIRVTGGAIVDSSEAAVMLTGSRIDRVRIDGVAVEAGGGHLLHLRAPGVVSLSGLRTGGDGMAGALVCHEGAIVTGLEHGTATTAPCGPVPPATR